MASIENTFLLIQVILSGILFFTMMWQRFRNKIKPMNWFVIIFGFAFFRSLVEYILVVIIPTRFPIYEIHFIPYALAIITFYLFAEYTNATKPSIMRSSIVFTLFGGFLFYFGLAIFGGENHQIEFWPLYFTETFYELPFDMMQLVVFSYVTYIFYKMTTLAQNANLKRTTILVTVAMSIMVLASIIEISEFFTNFGISSAITTIPAFIIFFVVYLTNPAFAYASPVRVFRIMIILENGPTPLNVMIDQKYVENKGSDAQLVGGVATSFNSLLREITLESEDNLEQILLGKTAFMIAKYKGIFAVIEAEQSTRVLRRALRDFAQDFYTTFEDILKNSQELTNNPAITPVISRYFQFYDPTVNKANN